MLLGTHNWIVEEAKAVPLLGQIAQKTANGSASITITFTTAPALGELIIIMIATTQNRPFNMVDFGFVMGDNNRYSVFYKIAGASEPTTYTVFIGGTYNATIVGLTFTRFVPLRPTTSMGSAQNGSNSVSHVIPTPAPTQINKFSYCIVFDAHVSFAASAFSNGFAQIADGNGGTRLVVASRGFTITEFYQTCQIDYTAGCPMFAGMFVINPKTF